MSHCHDSVVYVLAPLKYVSVFGCSDSIIVLGAVGKVNYYIHYTMSLCSKVRIWGIHICLFHRFSCDLTTWSWCLYKDVSIADGVLLFLCLLESTGLMATLLLLSERAWWPGCTTIVCIFWIQCWESSNSCTFRTGNSENFTFVLVLLSRFFCFCRFQMWFGGVLPTWRVLWCDG